MKTIFWMLLATVVSLTLVSPDADAGRLGGGRSIGAQRSAPTQVQKQAAPTNSPAAAPAQPVSPPAPATTGRNRWLGPLAGLAAVVGLGALLAHGGLGAAVAMLLPLLLIGVVVLLVLRLIRGARASAASPMRYAGAGPELRTPAGYETQPPPARLGGAAGAMPSSAEQPALVASVSATPRYPPGFEPEPFLQHAKAAYVRVQAAFDRVDFETLGDLLTPEMLSETRAEISGRGAAHVPTEIVTLEAQLIEVVAEGLLAWASVRFSGLIREQADTPPQHFDEVWNLQKPLSGETGWRLAGIQQLT
jgi:predicted lipid-binding transport protein (Tim44 family)